MLFDEKVVVDIIYGGVEGFVDVDIEIDDVVFVVFFLYVDDGVLRIVIVVFCECFWDYEYGFCKCFDVVFCVIFDYFGDVFF